MRILIGVPTTGTPDVKFAECLLKLRSEKHEISQMFIAKSIIHIAREQICDTAIRQGFDAVLFVDDDMVFEPDLVDRMCAIKAPIASAMCFKRVPPYTPCVYNDLSVSENQLKASTLGFDTLPKDRFLADATGSACMMITADTLRKIPKPWFLPLPYAGEDLSFCLKAKKAGYRVMVDPRIRVGHLETRAIYAEHYLNYKEGEK